MFGQPRSSAVLHGLGTFTRIVKKQMILMTTLWGQTATSPNPHQTKVEAYICRVTRLESGGTQS